MSRWNGKRIFVAYGGESSEREISLRTGQALAAALTEAGLAPQLIDVTRATIGALIEARPDVVLVAMHGHLGEDGALQGLLEWMGVPYTGSGVLASALAMDKLRTKQVLVAHNIPTPAWEVWTEAKKSEQWRRTEWETSQSFCAAVDTWRWTNRAFRRRDQQLPTVQRSAFDL